MDLIQFKFKQENINEKNKIKIKEKLNNKQLIATNLVGLKLPWYK